MGIDNVYMNKYQYFVLVFMKKYLIFSKLSILLLHITLKIMKNN
jgi:hypothetical protein